MKRLLVFALVLALAGAALYFPQHRKTEDAVNANALVDVAADWQHDLSRAPMHFTRLSDADEIRIDRNLVEAYGLGTHGEDPRAAAIQDYLRSVGTRLASHAHRKLPFAFLLDENPDMINAFALPGGYVVVGLGLLRQMRSEDELAFVLGHEIEHIDHYHSVERVQVEAQLHKLNLDVVAEIAGIPLTLWQAGYTKDQEFEADREGLLLAAEARYSPQGALDLLNTFVRLDREYITHSQTPRRRVGPPGHRKPVRILPISSPDAGAARPDSKGNRGSSSAGHTVYCPLPIQGWVCASIESFSACNC
jgi:predicted Zn-dependent protease